jgi:plasmid stabilization system protein ParE
MAYKVVIIPDAKQDIKEAAKWYNERQKDLGKRFINSISKEITIIRNNPFLYEIRYQNVRTALAEMFPYLIHFSIYNELIVIKAVYHTSRNSDLWLQKD